MNVILKIYLYSLVFLLFRLLPRVFCTINFFLQIGYVCDRCTCVKRLFSKKIFLIFFKKQFGLKGNNSETILIILRTINFWDKTEAKLKDSRNKNKNNELNTWDVAPFFFFCYVYRWVIVGERKGINIQKSVKINARLFQGKFWFDKLDLCVLFVCCCF